jgi:hypothetical protein
LFPQEDIQAGSFQISLFMEGRKGGREGERESRSIPPTDTMTATFHCMQPDVFTYTTFLH